MIVPQPTAQYGQVERVSLARAILRVRSWAKAGWRSKPKTAAAVPPIEANFRKSRREASIRPPASRWKSDAENSLNPFEGQCQVGACGAWRECSFWWANREDQK